MNCQRRFDSSELPALACQQKIAGSDLPAANWRLQVLIQFAKNGGAEHERLPPHESSSLPAANCQQWVAGGQLSAVNCQRRFASSKLPAVNCQQCAAASGLAASSNPAVCKSGGTGPDRLLPRRNQHPPRLELLTVNYPQCIAGGELPAVTLRIQVLLQFTKTVGPGADQQPPHPKLPKVYRRQRFGGFEYSFSLEK